MDCKDIKEHMIDYLGGTIAGELRCAVEEHLRVCEKCRLLAKDLERTASLVRMLDPVPVPAGFEKRLSQRIVAHQSASSLWHSISSAIIAIGQSLLVKPVGRRILRPAIAMLLLCALIGGSLFLLLSSNNRVDATDRAFIEVCREQHMSFAAANPLADESALLLKERMSQMSDNL